MARGAVHAALARRGSRVALYDLREAFDGAQTPLPLDFLTAVTAIGDASCLEPMARAWSTAPPGEAWWRDRLADAAADIVSRLSLTGRNPDGQTDPREVGGISRPVRPEHASTEAQRPDVAFRQRALNTISRTRPSRSPAPRISGTPFRLLTGSRTGCCGSSPASRS